MFPRLSVSAAVCAAMFLQAASAQQDLSDAKKRTSYAIGVQMGNFLKQGAELIDVETLVMAMKAVLAGQESQLSQQEVQELFSQFQREAQRIAGEKAGAEGKAFLEANKKKEGVVELPSGLQYKVITAGTGKSPTAADSVRVHYRGTLIDGTQFDSSYDRGEPIEFGVTRVIAGWTEALQLMKEGAKWEIYIPYDLAYGANGAGSEIPPFATLVFEVELLQVIPARK